MLAKEARGVTWLFVVTSEGLLTAYRDMPCGGFKLVETFLPKGEARLFDDGEQLLLLRAEDPLVITPKATLLVQKLPFKARWHARLLKAKTQPSPFFLAVCKKNTNAGDGEQLMRVQRPLGGNFEIRGASDHVLRQFPSKEPRGIKLMAKHGRYLILASYRLMPAKAAPTDYASK